LKTTTKKTKQKRLFEIYNTACTASIRFKIGFERTELA
jgi:hypothetical protein